jgi:chromosomal replication initiation ATPase DnaA
VSMIVHAHLNPNHPAVLAKRAIQARQKAQMEAKLARDRKVASDALALQEAKDRAYAAHLAAIENARSLDQRRLEREEAALKKHKEDTLLAEMACIRKNDICNRQSRVKKIINDVSESTGASVEDIVSGVRLKHVVLARHEAIATVARDTSMTLGPIGRVFGRDHTSVTHAIRNWNEITGQNIRNMGGIEKKRERQRIAHAARRARARLMPK